MQGSVVANENRLWLAGPFRHGGYSELDVAADVSTMFVARRGYAFPEVPPPVM